MLVCLSSGIAAAQPADDSTDVESVELSTEEVDLDTTSSSDVEPDPEDPASTPCAPVEDKKVKVKKKAAKPPAKTAKMRFTLASVKNWPEFKTTYPVKTVANVLGNKVKTKVPQSWRRSCKKKLFAEVSYPKDLEPKGKNAIKECSKKAAVVSVAVAIETGPSGALTTFTGSLEACVKIASAKLASEVSTSIESDKDCNKWRKF